MIRGTQMDIFAALALNSFRTRLIRHVRVNFPQEYEAIGPRLVHLFLELGIKSARRYGLESERDICGYIDLMLIFGPDFDNDQKIPWAGRLLKDNKLPREAKMPTLLNSATIALKAMRS